MKYVLVTGGYGFIGGHLLRRLIAQPDVEKIQVIDNETEGFVQLNKDILHVSGKGVEFPLYLTKPDTIFHLAAASHVDSVNGHPISALDNVEAMHDTLRRARECSARLIVLSTDEVYGETWQHSPGRTYSPLLPSSPYSASKAACDMLVHGWHKTYGVNAVIVRAGNNYGDGQHKSKFIPKLIDCIKRGEEFPMYGNGDYYRSWQHVNFTVEFLIRAAINPAYRGIEHATQINQYLSNMQIVEQLQDRGIPVRVKHVPDRPAHDKSYYCLPTFHFEDNNPKLIDYIVSQL